MDFSPKTRTAIGYTKDIESGKYNMKHKLQRKEGQWNNRQRGELIDSMLRSYPLDPIRCEVKEDTIGYVFDGIQRSTNIRDFLQDVFSLPKSLKPVTLDGIEYEIAGKKFSELEENVQDKIKNYEILIYNFINCTEEDIREMYRRQNSGKQLSGTQKRTAIESDELSRVVFALADHAFFTKVLSPTQMKRDVPRDIIRETLMLVETNNENDFTSFKAKDIDAFVIWYGDNLNEEKFAILTDVLDKFDESFDEIKIAITSLPMILYSGYRILKDKKSFSRLVESIKEFVENYDSNEEYKKYVTDGTNSRENVRGRFDYWRNIIKSI